MPVFMINRDALRSRSRIVWTILGGILIFVLLCRRLATYAIEFAWRTEMNQVSAYVKQIAYTAGALSVGTIIAFTVFQMAHTSALKFAGTNIRAHPRYARFAPFALLLLAYLASSASIDRWILVRFVGSLWLPNSSSAWRDPIFQHQLTFYLFDLPFCQVLRVYTMTVVITGMIIHWTAARVWQLAMRQQPPFARTIPARTLSREVDISILRLDGGFKSKYLQLSAAALMITLAATCFLGRYEMLYTEHGSMMVGIEYGDQRVGLVLQWLLIAAFIVGGLATSMGRWKVAAWMLLPLLVANIAPRVYAAIWVTPNELSVERQFIEWHIRATRAAYRLDFHSGRDTHQVRFDSYLDVAANRQVLEDVPIWDAQAFEEIINQRQLFRTYYTFDKVGVDRYTIANRRRQVLAAAREIDVRQLSGGTLDWINQAFIFTHGYGLVLSEANRMTAKGLPTLSIFDIPPKVDAAELKITRPEIYYGKRTHEPVFVNTTLKEFNYPAIGYNQKSEYQGTGGFPIHSLSMRAAAAIYSGELSVVLANYFEQNSRMMIHRKLLDRLTHLAEFIEWDTDPYLVITNAGRLVWIVDGYTTSDRYPYAKSIEFTGMPRLNYIRNSIKATVDAYDGTTRLYVFDADDLLINTYRQMFPGLFRPSSDMPPDLRAHTRSPETLMRIQSEMYQLYHITDTQSFYSREDLWDVAMYDIGDQNRAQPIVPLYVSVKLPGESEPEFVLLSPFTPHHKNNLLGVLIARCDGVHLGEMVELLLPKGIFTPGPMNILAAINQDYTISKELTLWGQMGSRVFHGQVIVLPLDDTVLYIDRIFIRAKSASMPEIKRVVLALGNRLVYAESYEKALASLFETMNESGNRAFSRYRGSESPDALGHFRYDPASVLDLVRQRLMHYRWLVAQGRYADAGAELRAIEAELK